jgi:hypothetical protein
MKPTTVAVAVLVLAIASITVAQENDMPCKVVLDYQHREQWYYDLTK